MAWRFKSLSDRVTNKTNFNAKMMHLSKLHMPSGASVLTDRYLGLKLGLFSGVEVTFVPGLDGSKSFSLQHSAMLVYI